MLQTDIITCCIIAIIIIDNNAIMANGQDTFTVTYGDRSNLATSEDAEYSCEITNRWTAGRHPRLYPTGKASWGAPVVVSHSSQYDMWGPGKVATPGIVTMAESGEASVLVEELDAESNNVEDIVIGQPILLYDDVKSQTVDLVTVSNDFPLITSIITVVPSPDWFSGFYGFNPRAPGNVWYESFAIDTFPWDAGSEQGDTYTTDNAAEPNPVRIQQLLPGRINEKDGVFLSDSLDEVRAVLNWNCVLQNAPQGDTGEGSTEKGGSSSSSLCYMCHGITSLVVSMLLVPLLL